MVIEGLELDFHVRRLHDLVDFAILLPANELPVLVCKLNLEPDLVMEGLCHAIRNQGWGWTASTIYLNHLELHYHIDGAANFGLQAVHFEAHTFEDYFRSRSDRDLFEEIRYLRSIQRCRRQQSVELYRQQPKRPDVVVTSLGLSENKVCLGGKATYKRHD